MNGINIPQYLRTALIMTVGVLLVFFIRNQVVEARIHDTLLLNLFHGAVPMGLALVLYKFHKMPGIVFWLIALIWILYYPNSPYMISDLKHLDTDPEKLKDYDDLILYGFSVLSLYYGFISLKLMYQVFIFRYSESFAKWMIGITLVLSCLGFYIGRDIPAGFHPGNLFTGDLFKHPILSMEAIWHGFFPISENLDGYAMMFLFGGVQLMLLVMMNQVNNIEALGNSEE